VGEILELPKIKNVIDSIKHEKIIGVNGEVLDGIFKPKAERYRLSEGQRVEIYRPLKQDPKERRRNKV
jgi:putative ubiquitin-RnfH superfamily antitoxin RatB of RatAB toxin-antitoxin module